MGLLSFTPGTGTVHMITEAHAEKSSSLKDSPAGTNSGTVFLLIDNSHMHPEVMGVFSSEGKARQWLDKAHDEWGWTWGEVDSASIEPWLVDAE